VGERPDAAALQLLLRKLASTGTFMETTAHPDDEDNALLATLGRGAGMRTVIVTATRGDGGQNEIGPELFQALGVLRTAELAAVHRFDGAEQFFTRAVDFGYSFSVEESIQKWGHDEIVGDYVRHIRAVRPDVVAGFLCGGEGGGQHHQASTRLTVDAFRAAADPAKYPEQKKDGLRPWQASRLFCTAPDTQSAAGPELLTVDVSKFDPILGRTYFDLGIEARSMHKCQGTSQLLPLPGQTRNRTYRLLDTAIGKPGNAPADLFDGIDTSILGLVRFAGPHPSSALTDSLASIAASVDDAARAASRPDAAVPALARGLGLVRELRRNFAQGTLDDDGRFEVDFRLAQKEKQFAEALAIAAGVRLEALADDGTVVAGQPVTTSLFVENNGHDDLVVKNITLTGLTAAAPACAPTVKPGAAATCRVAAAIPQDARVTGPYWTPRTDAARYDFDPDVPFGYPFRPSPFRAEFVLSIGGAAVHLDRPLQYRYDEVIAGEKRMEVSVVPAFAVSMTPEIIVVPASGGGSRDVSVLVANRQKAAASGVVALEVPKGWRVEPQRMTVSFAREDEQSTVHFTLTPPAAVRPGEFVAHAVLSSGSQRYDSGYDVVDYPHIERRHVPEPAVSRVKVIDVTPLPGLLVGYVMGVGDQVPQAIAQLGAKVEMIDAETLASGDLSRYSVIVTGVRAYERRADLRANNKRLLDYAAAGGTVLVQYNKFEFNEAQYGPFPAKVSSNRVTDEDAPVDVLVPGHPVFNTPNRIGPDAWTGWVQERGLYFLGDRDPRYVDLVRLSDPFPYNPGEKTGALVEARTGRGRWIYIGLGLWRQLPAGTDGAYKLMANLLSLRPQS
jgi:LmbE family N-acetylglucosaminyl deacetylase